VMIVINPDAHSTGGLADLDYGVAVARRGWLGRDHVFNTRPLKAISRALDERRGRV
jgi:DNA polymerase (family 10)